MGLLHHYDTFKRFFSKKRAAGSVFSQKKKRFLNKKKRKKAGKNQKKPKKTQKTQKKTEKRNQHPLRRPWHPRKAEQARRNLRIIATRAGFQRERRSRKENE